MGVVSFEEFIEATRRAKLTAAASSTSPMADEAAFGRMKQYILERYAGSVVVGSILVGAQVFDCIVERPSVDSVQRPRGQGCPEGSIPMRRVTLEELLRFGSVERFLNKSPEEG